MGKNISGETLLTNSGDIFTVISEYGGMCDIKFEDGTLITRRKGDCIRGKVSNPSKPTYSGVGFIGIGEYKIYSGRKKTKEGQAWIGMLRRCYSENRQYVGNWYDGCMVENEWHNFQNFAAWYCTQSSYGLDGMELDKDILNQGGKLYSRDTCIIVPKELNSAAVKLFSARGYEILPSGKYRVRTRHGLNDFSKIFENKEDAYSCFTRIRKKEILRIINKHKMCFSTNVLEKLVGVYSE